MHKCVNNTVGNVYHLEQLVDNFFPYSQKQLGFDQPATIVFQSDEENASRMLGKTAYYNPETYEVVLYTDNRHPKDVMRSLSHELVHHAQNCRGEFASGGETEEGYAQKDPHLRQMEREAYTKGNLIFRDFEDLIKTGKINIEIDFSDSGEPKMSLKEWKNNEINTKLMKKWGLLKEGKMPMKPDTAEDLDDDGKTDDQVPAFLEEDSEGEETYHYGEDEGRDDRELQDGTILERVAAEDIQVTNASLAEGHDHPMRDEDDEEESGMHKQSEEDPADYTGTRKREKRAVSALKKGKGLEEVTAGKISVREVKELTQRIIQRLTEEGK